MGGSRRVRAQAPGAAEARLRHDLRERRKELRCLYGIVRAVETSGTSVGRLCQETASLLPSAFEHPQATCARIRVRGKEFRTPRFRETPKRFPATIFARGKAVGVVEVYDLRPRTSRSGSPFLKEERTLVRAVAERLGRRIAHVEALRRLRKTRRALDRKRAELREARLDLREIVSLQGGAGSRTRSPGAESPGNSLPKREPGGTEPSGLTAAEAEVWDGIQMGLSTKEIAKVRKVTPGTVSRHRERIREKLGLVGRGISLGTYLRGWGPEARRSTLAGSRAPRASCGPADVAALEAFATDCTLQLVDALLPENSPEAAEQVLRSALRTPLRSDRALWDRWIGLSLGRLRRDARKILDDPLLEESRRALPPESEGCRYLDDLRWLLTQLADRRPLHINCGGPEHADRDGRLWTRDRFFVGGNTAGSPSEPRFLPGIRDGTIYRTERWFPRGSPGGYRLPLPDGRYRVRLHFTQCEPGPVSRHHRRFGVVVGGTQILHEFAPRRGVGETHEIVVDVTEGRLEIELVPGSEENPKVSGIEVFPLGAGTSPDAT